MPHTYNSSGGNSNRIYGLERREIMKISDVIARLAEYISENGDEELPENFHIYYDGHIDWY